MSGSEKGKKRKMKGRKKGADPLIPPGSHLAGGRCSNNGCSPLCPHLCDQKQQSVIRGKIPDIWRIGSFLPTMVPTSCVQAAPKTCAQLPAMWLIVKE